MLNMENNIIILYMDTGIEEDNILNFKIFILNWTKVLGT